MSSFVHSFICSLFCSFTDLLTSSFKYVLSDGPVPGAHTGRPSCGPSYGSQRDKAGLAWVFSDARGSMGLFSCLKQAESRSEVMGADTVGACVYLLALSI